MSLISGHFHEEALIRTPFYPLAMMERCLGDPIELRALLIDMSANPQFREMILVASLEMYEKLDHWHRKAGTDADDVAFTLFKYLLRGSSQPTPFGLFASYSFVRIDKKASPQSAVLMNSSSTRKKPRIDSGLYYSVIQQVNDYTGINLFLNPTIFIHDGKVKYLDRKIEHGFFEVEISSVELSETLELVFEQAKTAILFETLVSQVADKTGEPVSDCESFILELVVNGVLLTGLELSPITHGDPYIDNVSLITKSLKSDAFAQLNKVAGIVDDRKVGETEQEILDAYSLFPGQRDVLQVDLARDIHSASIPAPVINQLNEALAALMFISKAPGTPVLTSFLNGFRERYDRRFVPLLELFDGEIGLSFESFFENEDPLLAGIHFEPSSSSTDRLQPVVEILKKRIIESSGVKSISLNELVDFNHIDHDHVKSIIPPSFSVITQLIDDPDFSLSIFAISQVSAINLVNRFSDAESKLAIDIANHEKDYFNGKIVVDINHIPNSPRAGNVVIRPSLWDYHINYLSGDFDRGRSIELSDIQVFVGPDDHVHLWSVSLERELVPRIASAINYQSQTNPLFRFFGMIQDQCGTPSIGVPWLFTALNLRHIPRIIYKRIIVSPETWLVQTSSLQKFSDTASAIGWAEGLSLPKRFVVVTKDGTGPVIDFGSEMSLRQFNSMIAKDEEMVLQEFIYDCFRSAVVDNDGGEFANQAVLTFLREREGSYA